MAKVKELTFIELVKKALDGRTNRWLSQKTGISESELSRILNGILIPSETQKQRIIAAFPFDITV